MMVDYPLYMISASGSLRPCVDRRNKGWGKVAEVTGILAEMPNERQIEVGLKLRETKIHNGILYNSEAWSNLTEKDTERIEQVDMAALRAIIGGGHSKCPKVFYFLEFGTLMIRHLIMIRRFMFHYHIVTRNNCELIKKVYLKQKDMYIKGDWIQLLKSDFAFIEEELNEEKILQYSKEQYNKYINEKIVTAAFKEYIKLKQSCKKKLENVHYFNLSIQPYMISTKFSLDDKKLLYSLRSKCYQAKLNFRKQNKGNLQCRLGCSSDETQSHIFEECTPILNIIGPGKMLILIRYMAHWTISSQLSKY